MEFRIADTFTDSLGKLTGDEQKAVKTTAFDLQIDPARPGMKLHQLEGAKDRDFWSVRVNVDIRLIVHRTASSFLLCYVDHHDAGYQWAVRRRLGRHPKTGAAQLVEIRETVRETRVPRYVEVDARASSQPAMSGPPPSPRAAIFAGASDDYLLGYGVPVEWLGEVRTATEDTLLDLADHLPAAAGEALLQLATGGAPEPRAPAAAGADPFAHPDAQRRFRVMADIEALQRALDYPWEKWTVFLHPAQRQIVEREYNGPTRDSGSAGTGKTIVALHRAVHLARAHPESRVLLATFSDELATALRTRLRRLIGNEPKIAERLEVHSMSGIGRRLYAANVGRLSLASGEHVRTLLDRAAAGVTGHRFTAHFLWTEWSTVVDAWQLQSWEDYRDVQRLGRKTRLAEKQRELLWSIFSRVRSALAEEGRSTEPAMFRRLAAQIAEAAHSPFDFCRGPGCRRCRAALARRPRRGQTERPVLRRRPRTADLPDPVLVAGAGRRRARAVSDATNQLPDLAPDPATGRPAAAPGAGRRRRQRREAGCDRLGVQRTGAGGQNLRVARARDGGHRRLAAGTRGRRLRTACDRRVRQVGGAGRASAVGGASGGNADGGVRRRVRRRVRILRG